MTDKVVVIVQARLGSTRLPGKILMPLNGYSVLEHVLARCEKICGKDNVICAGVDTPKEKPVRELVESLGYKFFAGSEADVLSRYYHAAKAEKADWVVRVTSDCPLLDPVVCRGLVETTVSSKADFGITVGWPHGLDCEVITAELLEQSYQCATSAADREHVTLWAKRAEGVKRLEYGPVRPIADVFNYRWVLDYPEDYELLSQLFTDLGILPPSDISYDTVISFLAKHSELLAVNQQRIQEWSEAYRKLLEQGQ